MQTAELRLNDGRATLALGFATAPRAAVRAARASLGYGFDALDERYRRGWHAWLDGFGKRPDSAAGHETHYDVSLMVLKATEDKTFHGASIASPSMPWAWGQLTIEDPSGPYHLV